MTKPFSGGASAVVPARPQLSPTGQDRTGQERTGENRKLSFPSQPMNPESVLANQQRLRALENASVADAEAIHDARHRIYRRQPEIVELREQLGVTP